MRLLHTADWHLGKKLEHLSRHAEQVAVLEEICEIAEREEVDAVLLAGDVFDFANPPTESIELLYKTLRRLSREGKCAVIGIAGNHDSPDRLEATDPLARECGIFLTGYPASCITPITLASGLSVTKSEPGFAEFQLPNQNTPLRVILTSYANENRLKQALSGKDGEGLREVLTQNWAELAEKYCDAQGVNVLMTHLFVMKKGGEKPEEGEDERSILTVGGAEVIFTDGMPTQMQYVALGHLHRQHQVKGQAYPVVYSGSPLSYSMAEAGQEKYVILVEVEAGQKAEYSRIPLKSGRILVRKRFFDTESAVQWLQENPDTLVEVTMETAHFLTPAEQKSIYDAHDYILKPLIPVVTGEIAQAHQRMMADPSADIETLFKQYFTHKKGNVPNEEVMEIFREVLSVETDNE